MKLKIYLVDYAMEKNNWRLIIVITYDECSFLANNKVQKV